MRSEHISQVVARPAPEVYAYAADPDHLPLWAAGLARSPARREGAELVVDSPMGPVRVRFVEPNDLGVLDHDVTLPDGQVVTNPMRVLAHPDGAEVVFTVRQRDLSDADFQRDVAAVAAELRTLAQLLAQ